MIADPNLTPVRLDGIPLVLHPSISDVRHELLHGGKKIYHKFRVIDPTTLYWLQHVKRIIGDKKEETIYVRLILHPSTTHDYIAPYLQDNGTRMVLVFRRVVMNEFIENVFYLRQLDLVSDVRILIALKML